MSDHIPDVTKMISDTPRTDRNYIGMQIVPASFAQQLERELNAVSKERDEAVFVTEKVLKEFSEHSRSRCKAIDELNAANERIKRLRDGIAKQNLEIEQTCGKVLDYPWFKDDQKNFPEATEKDGVCVGEHVAETIVSELAKKHAEALNRIKRLEESENRMLNWLTEDCPESVKKQLSNAWMKSKEAKP